MPLLLAAVPSLADTWRDIQHDPLHIDDEESGTRLHYLDAGAVARHLVALHLRGRTDELTEAFEAIERLHREGDEYVRELATIGYLEDVQNAATRAGLDPAVFEEYLGPESGRSWRRLEEFWQGRSPTVEPGDPTDGRR